LFGVKGLPSYQPCSAAKGCHPTSLVRRQRVAALPALSGGKGLPPYFYVGRHPHADRRGLQPASTDALFGGKVLPPYFYQVNEGPNYHKAFFIFPHKTMNRQT